MTKKEIKEKYNELVSTIEDANIYDGRGKYDLYFCKDCSRRKVTTYAVKGVTPASIMCACGKQMWHTQTFNGVPDHISVEKWVRPTLEQTLRMTAGMIKHILNGGLLLESEIK